MKMDTGVGGFTQNVSSESTAVWSSGKDGTYEISGGAYAETAAYYDRGTFQETTTAFSSGAWVGGEYWSTSISTADESYSAPYRVADGVVTEEPATVTAGWSN